jgi:Beta-galactosidase trimerisation domain
MRPLTALVLLGLFAMLAPAQSKLKPEEVPTFKLRARVTSLGGQEPDKAKLSFHVAGGKPANVTGAEWSEWLPFDRAQVEATLKGYPALYMKGYPVVVKLSVGGVKDPTKVEAELKFDEADETVKLSGELFGPSLGVLVWRDDQMKPHAATMAEYNHRYWKVLDGVQLPEAERPKKFPIVDRFIGGDDDRIAWREGIENLNKAGFSAIMLPPSKPVRELLLQAGQRRTAWAVYNPPGYAFAHDPKITPEEIAKWAEQQAKPYLDAGYAREDMAVFAMSDEPGWYYPKIFQALTANPAALQRFRDYLKAQGLNPEEVGAKDWEGVQPLARSQAKDLPSRRLFYWTMRFFAHDSAQHFADCTRALGKAFYPGLPVFTNWNFFAGRFYVPGPVANNADKTSPDAAMGGHDWLEFGKLRGGTMLWTEDWFGDGKAYQWSFYCAKLRCAAEKGGVQFGAYVIPRTAGDREDGIVQKILCVVGSGGKAVKYFVFGPEYNFPGNCYSEKAAVLPKMAEAHRMIGKAEDILWPGQRPKPEVAILMPRSAQVWDAKDVEVPKMISDATNTNLNGATVDYMAEVFDLYLALQHANIPADFVDEDDLSEKGLKPYKVVYITAPNIPEEGQRGLVDWVKAGGTLITVKGTGQRDRYDEPCDVLSQGLGIKEFPRDRVLVANANALKSVGTVDGGLGSVEAVGARGKFATADGDVRAKFEDGTPAILERKVGKGRAVHFAWLPGLSYWKSATTVKDKMPAGFSAALLILIAGPADEAVRERLPVIVRGPMTDRPQVETPLLLSDKGAAVTLLNWSGENIDELNVAVRLPFKVKSVESVKRGRLTFQETKDGATITLPLGAVDVVTLRP